MHRIHAGMSVGFLYLLAKLLFGSEDNWHVTRVKVTVNNDVSALTIPVFLARVVTCLKVFPSLASPALVAMKEC